MRTRVVAALAVLILAAPNAASADFLTDLQSQVLTLVSYLRNVQTQLDLFGSASTTANPTTAINPDALCVNLTKSIGFGDKDATTDGEVTKLQKFLKARGIYSGSITGNVGPLTVQAIQSWQASKSILSSGSATSTGFGILGAKTRESMSCGVADIGYNTATSTPSTSTSTALFIATPRSGARPLSVGFFVASAVSASEYSIEFGDGASATTLSPNICTSGAISCGYGTAHTYTQSGSYVAKLYKSGSAGNIFADGCATSYCLAILNIANSSAKQLVAVTEITVGSSTSTGTTAGSGGTAAKTLTWITPRAKIQLLYLGYLGRLGESAGVEYWLEQLNAGTSIAKVAQSFGLSIEAKVYYPFLANPTISSPSVFIDKVYDTLFDREPDAGGEAYWIDQIESRIGNDALVAQIILDIISGAQGADATTMLSKIPDEDFEAPVAPPAPPTPVSVQSAVFGGFTHTFGQVIPFDGGNNGSTGASVGGAVGGDGVGGPGDAGTAGSTDGSTGVSGPGNGSADGTAF